MSIHDSSPPACILVHGGASWIPDVYHEKQLEALDEALRVGRKMINKDVSAIGVATEVVASMESSGVFDAGRGSVLSNRGEVEMDSGLMCGHTMRFGGVIGVKHYANPIYIARNILLKSRGEARLLSEQGAVDFGATSGLDLVPNEVLISERERDRFLNLSEKKSLKNYHTSEYFLPNDESHIKGTVGCVVLDRQGHLVAATSTGGTPFHPSGRIGDSALPGCGYYANQYAAASATGWGEAIIANVLCARVVDNVASSTSPSSSCDEMLRQMSGRIFNANGIGAAGGVIAIAASGESGWAFTTPHMAVARWRDGDEPWCSIESHQA